MYLYEDILFTDAALDLFLEAIDDFPKDTRSMYRFAKRKHDDTHAIRKATKQPYWVHPEGVAYIVMQHGGNNIEIKAALAHDTVEDTGATLEDIEEKFGKRVADIVAEVTNDRHKLLHMSKEDYINIELCKISPEALTVKLADILYNQRDYPTEKNYKRMRNNVLYMLQHRDNLEPINIELANEILSV
jgi:(p)ppGpp synthase/HD superfamily hydrolase